MVAEKSLSALAEALGPQVGRDVALAPFTSMRVGGPADLLTVAESTDELAEAVRLARAHGVPWRVLGGGCNVLIADEGLRGLVIVNRAGSVARDGQVLRAESGAMLAAVAQRAVEAGLIGLAWAVGLPGTVGGAVVGNAGAFGGDIATVLRNARILEPDHEVRQRPNEWFEFRYRGSRLKGTSGGGTETSGEKPEARAPGYVVLEAVFELEAADADAVEERADEILTWRRTRHPSGATMGSTFKNPPGDHAGRLIEKAGLKGARIGGVQISEQHANFLMNLGGATAREVLALIEHAQGEVERQFGVVLELEIEMLGWNGGEGAEEEQTAEVGRG